MRNKITVTSFFASRLKRLVKKFFSLEGEIDSLIQQLTEDPTLGIPLGGGLYKIRIASKSKGGGKSGGFRVITYLVKEKEDGTDVYLITMFDKSEESSIKKEQLVKLIKLLLEP